MVARIMNLGGYDDILRLEEIFSPDELARVMIASAPGWFSDWSWEFWRGRLSRSSEIDISTLPPRREFLDASRA